MADEPPPWQIASASIGELGKGIMAPEAAGKARWRSLAVYLQFERAALVCVLLMISAIAVFAIVFTLIKLATDMWAGEAFLDKAALQETLGFILTILILLEFNHSVYQALKEHTGAIQTRILVLITILVILRKMMLMDFTTIETWVLFGFGAMLLALGGLYWLISDGDRRHQQGAQQEGEPAKESETATGNAS